MQVVDRNKIGITYVEDDKVFLWYKRPYCDNDNIEIHWRILQIRKALPLKLFFNSWPNVVQ